MKMNENKFGPVPFWFWNGDQQEEEITRQLDLAKQGGWRGFALHARDGNKTPYLSERWFQLVRHACMEAKKRNLELWLYDEEGYPSGTVGHRLPVLDEKYQQKRLLFDVMSASEAARTKDVLKCFDKQNPQQEVDLANAPADQQVLVFQRKSFEFFVDNLNEVPARKFLEMTHDLYEQYVGEFLGSTLTVVYTDDIASMYGKGKQIVWSDILPARFYEEYGYSILDNLSALVENTPDCKRIRRDFRKLTSTMLGENYIRPMVEWAHNHNMIFTGHLCGDEGPMAIIFQWYGDASAFYLAEDIPGIDDFLTGNHSLNYMSESRNDFGFLLNTVRGFPISTLVKNASSVASQVKDGKCSAEVLTSLGWGVPVPNQMAQLLFEFGLGVNIIVHHDCSYTTEGLTKRDHPASFFFQQPYFPCNADLYQPIKRTLALLNRGHIAADVLIINPINAIFETEDGELQALTAPVSPNGKSYTCTKPQENGTHDSRYFTEFMQKLNIALLQRHVSFEYGYERIIEKYGKVEGNRLILGDCSYSIVIVPGFNSFSQPVQNLLDQFRKNGGIIYSIDSVSELPENLPADLDGDIPEDVLTSMRVSENGKREYYLVNFAKTPRNISLLNNESLEFYDPHTGCTVTDSGKCPSHFCLPPLKQCHLLPAGTMEDVDKIELSKTFFNTNPRKTLLAATNWNITRLRNNTLVIDHAIDQNGLTFLMDKSEYSELKPGTFFTAELNCDANLAGTQIQFYCETSNVEESAWNGIRAMEYPLEHPATQALHGTDGWLLTPGKNILTVKGKSTRLEFMYIEGDFGVALNGDKAKIVPNQKLTFGDLTEQGLPFYHGAVKYELVFELPDTDTAKFLSIPQVDGVAEVFLNGEKLGIVYGSFQEIRLKNAKPGKNVVTLILRNTAQNFFGPHRRITQQKYSCCSAWHPVWREQTADNDFVTAAFGIMEPPTITEETGNC